MAYWRGKEELEAMDDILPVYIFIVLQAKVKNLPSFISLVDEYVRASQDMESEQRIVVNYQVAIEYIVREI